MTTFTAIVRKESRQQGALAAAMVLFCLVLQLAFWLLSFFPEFANVDPAYFAVAVMSTALFTGAATAISFSGEQEDGTFGFLRNLPVSARTVFFGKTAWLLLATLLVLAGTSLLALFWKAIPHGTSSLPPLSSDGVMSMFGIGIVEAFAWGLFWSPRCRSQIIALLATYFCASTVGYYAALFSGGNTFAEIYGNAVPVRLTIAAVVGALGVWSCLHWFDRYVQRRSDYGTNSGRKIFGPLPYPKQLQRPFFALLHQSIRQSQTLLLVGLAVSVVASSWFLFKWGPPWAKTDYEFGLLGIVAVLFYFFFCAGIFAQDQKNESYRFLSRCGVSARSVWWSRVLPFFAVTLLTCVAVFVAWKVLGTLKPDPANDVIRRCAHWYALALFMIPFSTGAFFSISCRYMIVGAALAGAASVVLFCWMMFAMLGFGLNPLWTTLPLCLAFLVASRLRTADWLRERRTWRSRFKVLIPVFATILAILAAVPAVRIYSIPFRSLDEIEARFAAMDIVEKLSEKERERRFDELRTRLHTPLPKEECEEIRLAILDSALWRAISRKYDEQHGADSISTPEGIKCKCRAMEKVIAEFPLYEEWLLDRYEFDCRRNYQGDSGEGPLIDNVFRFLPWEKTRYLRRINGYVYDFAQKEPVKRRTNDQGISWYDDSDHDDFRNNTILDFRRDVWYQAPFYRYKVCRAKLELTRLALYGWYLEHDAALPESLDELAGTYLTKIPTDPFTGEAIRYEPNRNEALIEQNRHRTFGSWMRKPGWPNLKLYDQTVDLNFLPGYDEYGNR